MSGIAPVWRVAMRTLARNPWRSVRVVLLLAIPVLLLSTTASVAFTRADMTRAAAIQAATDDARVMHCAMPVFAAYPGDYSAPPGLRLGSLNILMQRLSQIVQDGSDNALAGTDGAAMVKAANLALQKITNCGMSAVSPDHTAVSLSTGVTAAQRNQTRLLAVGAVATVVVVLLAIATFATYARRLRHDSAILQIVGASDGQVRSIMSIQGAVSGLLGGVLGAGLVAIAVAVFPKTFSILFGNYDAAPFMSPLMLIGFAFLGVVMGLAASWLAARSAADGEPTAMLNGAVSNGLRSRRFPIGYALLGVAAIVGSALVVALAPVPKVDPSAFPLPYEPARVGTPQRAVLAIFLCLLVAAIAGLLPWLYGLLARRLRFGSFTLEMALRDLGRSIHRSVPSALLYMLAAASSTAGLIAVNHYFANRPPSTGDLTGRLPMSVWRLDVVLVAACLVLATATFTTSAGFREVTADFRVLNVLGASSQTQRAVAAWQNGLTALIACIIAVPLTLLGTAAITENGDVPQFHMSPLWLAIDVLVIIGLAGATAWVAGKPEKTELVARWQMPGDPLFRS